MNRRTLKQVRAMRLRRLHRRNMAMATMRTDGKPQQEQSSAKPSSPHLRSLLAFAQSGPPSQRPARMLLAIVAGAVIEMAETAKVPG